MTSLPPESNRRDFLLGKSAVCVLQHALPEPAEAGAEPAVSSEPQDSYLVQVGRTAMACDFEIYLNAFHRPGETEAAVAALDLVDQLEAQLTVYRATSEVIEINQRAAREPVVVEPRLFALLQLAVELHAATGGAFDITSGPLSKAWGFFRRAGQFPTPEAIAEALSRVGSHWIELDADARTVRFLRPGLEINLNAIGKGCALDRCAELLVGRGVTDFLLHGGKSSILAYGSRASAESHGQGWPISIKHPFRPEERLVELRLCNRAVGTSGAANQFFHFQGKRYGHILDPRTGWPADRVLSATVLAPTAAEADALATALYVMGVQDAIQFCSSRPHLAAILVTAGQRSGDVELHAVGLAPEEWRQAM